MKIISQFILSSMCWLLLLHNKAVAQESTSLYSKVLHFPDRLFKKVDDKTADINRRLVKQTDKYLQRMANEEQDLQRKLAQKDFVAASRIFGDAQAQYTAMQARINSLPSKVISFQGTYIPHIDSLQTAFGFLNKTNGVLSSAPQVQKKLTDALCSMKGLQDKFTQTEAIKSYLRQRQQYLQQQLGKYNMSSELKQLKKQVYYYQEQVDAYKQQFSDPSRLEAKAMELLKGTPKFKEFFSNNSQLAAMFSLPGSGSTAAGSYAGFTGMQTRASVQQDMQQKFGSGAEVQQALSQQVQEGAQTELSRLKDKVLKAGGTSSEEPMPDFKPNHQKTRTFLQRLELGSNMQSVKANRFFPSTTDIGLSLGYKLNDRSILGIGASYKMAWGKNIRHMSISHQGVGVRSFVDYKLKGSIWLSGGAEMNYRSACQNFDILRNYSAWQKSALLGLSKKYQVGKKLKGNMQLFYDFLYKQQVPRTQAVLFRLGYTFK